MLFTIQGYFSSNDINTLSLSLKIIKFSKIQVGFQKNYHNKPKQFFKFQKYIFKKVEYGCNYD